MIDAEFEQLDAELIALLRSHKAGTAKRRREVVALLARCRDCDRLEPEDYWLPRNLWLAASPTGRGQLCLDCLARRLGRPPVPVPREPLPARLRRKLAGEGVTREVTREPGKPDRRRRKSLKEWRAREEANP